MKVFRTAILLTILAPVTRLTAQDSGKVVKLGGTYGAGRLPGIVVLPVPGSNGDSVRAMLQRDLENGDRVTIIGRDADGLPPVSGTPNYDAFAQLGAASIVQASVTPQGELHVAFHSVAEKRPVQARQFDLAGSPLSGEWRMSVHRAADSLELWATGVVGISATRIAFIREGKVWTVDSDGAGAVMVEGAGYSMSPAWHPSGRYLAFSTLDPSSITMRDLSAGTSRRMTPVVANTSNSAPAFSPDGNTLAFARATADGTEIYLMDAMKGGAARKILTGREGGINTLPSFSPDSRQFAFVSGRLRNPQVYISDVDGSNVRLLTDEGVGDRNYGRTNPSWAPDGHAIAYQSDNENRFQIMTISPSGKNITVLTGESANEHPSWAPDSRHLVFSSVRSGKEQLWVLDTEGARTRQLTFGSTVSKMPAWSPQIPRK
ncbi:MAG TPA: hypothetical protein VE967_06870 [Gemmatimonadaceae bacterium]|nr:hypothetical protein [Gemmatimonadaceae bacterium]